MAKKSGARILGPYADKGNQWRIIEIDASGQRRSHIADNQRAAQKLLTTLKGQQRSGVAMEVLIEEHLAVRDMQQRYRVEAGRSLRRFFDGCSIDELTPRRAAALLERRQGAVASRRLWLKQARSFCGWLVSAGLLAANPFASCKVAGRAKAGKPQLRISEAQQFTAVAFARYEAGEHFALAPLLCLMMGLRASEACKLTVRDVDARGAVLWVMGTKTANAARRLKVPIELRPLLTQLSEGRASTERLFGQKARQCLHREVTRLCKLAAVPRVCTHSLRGLWATLAVESGQACEAVAAALGHGSFAVTARHYAQPSAVHAADTDRVGAALFRDRSAEPN